jgi:EAL domain-containing protein (putative c-di-GMP-specific phosphodiesterase class I)
MCKDLSNDLIVHSVIDLGHNLGLSIVAEGVEDAQMLATLKDYGCDVAQGYYSASPSRPMSSQNGSPLNAHRTPSTPHPTGTRLRPPRRPRDSGTRDRAASSTTAC